MGKDELHELEDELMGEVLAVEFEAEDDYGYGDDEGDDEFDLIEDGDGYESPEEKKEDIEEIEQEITDLEEADDDGRLAEQKETSIEILKEIEESEKKELKEEEAIEEKLEDLHSSPPDAFVDGESKSSWGNLRNRIGSEGKGDVAKYGVWLAIPLVLLLLLAAYRCKSRRGSSPRRIPPNGNDGFADFGDFSMS